MNLLNRIRQLASGLLGRSMLAWLLLSLGAASAAPLVHPQSMEIVCTSMGDIRLVVTSDDGAQTMGASHWECAMCLPFTAPPSTPVVAVDPPPSPYTHALQPVEAARIAGITAAPLPARGPPRFA
ncbi:hypothetical protein [Diaphorobacter caeni]|uniref:hypothetical protein n=1 Tax=Diaphorobacter caeni TaxID=2784387 RepID=UPI00188DE765|nr:hypothetical protein [Diaphorobacter caeni]MBF5004566.1 hypothetical protein [Diaphorobacter caeni]